MKNSFSIKNRLLIQLFAITSILVVTFFFTIKSFIGKTVISTQDGLLSASLGSIIKKIESNKMRFMLIFLMILFQF